MKEEKGIGKRELKRMEAARILSRNNWNVEQISDALYKSEGWVISAIK